jgi:hypothetical protein
MIVPIGTDIGTHYAHGKHNLSPDIYGCPFCPYHRRLRRHGFYYRNVICFFAFYRLPVQRYLCPRCRRTISALPSFLVPYFQYSLSIIVFCLWCTLVKKYSYLRTCACVNSRVKEAALSYQHISLYRKRAKSNLGLIRTHLSAIGLFGASGSEWL